MIKETRTLPKRQSAVPNTLTSSSSKIAYIGQNNSLVIIPKETLISKASLQKQIVVQLSQIISDIRFVKLSGIWRLVVAYSSGYSVLDQQGIQLTVLSTGKGVDKKLPFFKGISSQENKLVVGTQLGHLFLTEQRDYKFITSQIKKIQQGIHSLIFFKNKIWIGLDNGQLLIISQTLQRMGSINLNSNTQITILIIHQHDHRFLIVAGDTLGCVHLLYQDKMQLMVSISAHARQVVGLLSHYGRLTSIGQDGYLVKWEIDGPVAKSMRVSQQMVCGMTLLWDKILVSIYSRKQMLIVE